MLFLNLLVKTSLTVSILKEENPFLKQVPHQADVWRALKLRE